MPRSLRTARRAAACAALALPVAASGQTFLGPTPYLRAADSPFVGLPFGYFHLETFEDGTLDTPGVTASLSSIVGPGPFTDSVDEDDGAVDGSGASGTSLLVSLSSSVRFTFDPVALGGLPTHAGIVWTDVGDVLTGTSGVGPVLFEVFGPTLPVGGVSFGPFTLGNGSALGTGGTAEDRFFGARLDGGISAIRISTTNSVDWEVDHLQYGRVGTSAVPEPATVVLVGGGLAALAALGRRRRRG